MAAACENNEGPKRRAMMTLKRKLSAETNADPSNRIMLPLNSVDAGLFARQSLQRVRESSRRGKEIVVWSELMKGFEPISSAAALDVDTAQLGA